MAEVIATSHTHEQELLAASLRMESPFRIVWRRFRKKKAGVLGVILLVLLSIACIVLPMLSTFDIQQVNAVQGYATFGQTDLLVGGTHWLGTDWLGRDFMVRLFVAGRTTLFVALISTLLVVIIGSIVGGIAGYYGGWIDTVLMRFIDFLLALPLLPLFLLAVRFLRQTPILKPLWLDPNANSYLTLAVISGVFILFSWMGLARLVRGSVLSLRTLTYVEAARALGSSNRRIVVRHLLPNSIAPILVSATFAVGDFIILESVLAYFNQGIYDPPLLSWGNLLVANLTLAYSITEPNPFVSVRGWLFFLPGLLVIATVLSINYIGDGLRNALDPHRR